MGQVSLPALLVELAVTTKQMKTREEQEFLWHGQPKVGWWVPAWPVSAVPQPPGGSSPTPGGSTSLEPREGQTLKTAEKCPKAPAVGFLHFCAFVG